MLDKTKILKRLIEEYDVKTTIDILGVYIVWKNNWDDLGIYFKCF